jgi:hypothetical protein
MRKEQTMQTIRIYSKSGELVATFTGPPNKTETAAMRSNYPESVYRWLR